MKRSQLLVLCVVLLVLLVPTGCIKSKPQPTSVPTTASGQVPTKVATATGTVVATATKSSAVAQQVTATATVAATVQPTGQPTGQPTAQPTPTQKLPATIAPNVEQPTVAPTVAPTTAANQGQQTGEQTYQVRWGDTLARIAKQFGVTTQAIVARNPQITNQNLIKAGWTLIIPASGTSPQPTAVPQPSTGFYTVQRGDTLSGIARRFGTTTTALRQANPFITNPNVIIPGQRLTIPGTSSTPAVGTHVVKAGETLSGIARLYNKTAWAFVVRNNLANANLIFVGQVLIIPE